MNCDSYYSIGLHHTECQDYAISWKDSDEKKCFSIIADGCSSSKFTDVGARMLAYIFKNLGLKKCCHWGWDFLFKEVVEVLKNDSKKLNETLNLPKEFLDCAMVLAYYDIEENLGGVALWGDGGFYVEYKDGKKDYFWLDFDNNAPIYLSYLIFDTIDNYNKVFPDNKIYYNNIEILPNGKIEKTRRDITQKYGYEKDGYDFFDGLRFNLENIKLVSCFSDGIKSFSKQTENKSVDIDEIEIINQFTAYKNFNGDFVKRRMIKMSKDHVKDNITHYDDISVSTIYVG